MQQRGMARWVGGQQRVEEKRQKPLNSFEAPSKLLRNITLTSRLPHPSSTLAAGWALADSSDESVFFVDNLSHWASLPRFVET